MLRLPLKAVPASSAKVRRKPTSASSPISYPHNSPNNLDHIVKMVSRGYQQIVFQNEDWESIYSIGPWSAPRAGNDSPFNIVKVKGRAPLLCSPDGKPGFADSCGQGSRIKSFGLMEAIRYSYWKDMRFVIVLCAMMGL